MLYRFVPLFILALGLAACAAPPEIEPVAAEAPLTYVDGFARQDIDIPTAAGVVHTEVVFRASAWLRSDRRVMVMIPGTLANGAGYYDAPRGTGYDAAEVLAREGFFVVLVDLPGSGESYRPTSGRDATVEVSANAVRAAAQVYSVLSHGRVDIYGETGAGTSTGLLLAREPWVRTFTASAVVYRRFNVGAATLFDPGFRASFDALPTGYLPQDPAFIAPFLGGAEPAIFDAALAACVGEPPLEIGTGTFYDLWDIPFGVTTGELGPEYPEFVIDYPIVDAAPAQAPAFFVQGSPDFVGNEVGTAELMASYGSTGGGAASGMTLPGANHLMRYEPVANGPSSAFWAPVIAFLDSH